MVHECDRMIDFQKQLHQGSSTLSGVNKGYIVTARWVRGSQGIGWELKVPGMLYNPGIPDCPTGSY